MASIFLLARIFFFLNPLQSRGEGLNIRTLHPRHASGNKEHEFIDDTARQPFLRYGFCVPSAVFRKNVFENFNHRNYTSTVL